MWLLNQWLVWTARQGCPGEEAGFLKGGISLYFKVCIVTKPFWSSMYSVLHLLCKFLTVLLKKCVPLKTEINKPNLTKAILNACLLMCSGHRMVIKVGSRLSLCMPLGCLWKERVISFSSNNVWVAPLDKKGQTKKGETESGHLYNPSNSKEHARMHVNTLEYMNLKVWRYEMQACQ